MFRSGIDLRGKTHILKVGLLAWRALLRCQRSLNSLVKCTTSRLPVNCLWTHQKSTCLRINEAPRSRRGSSSHTYLSPRGPLRFFLETAEREFSSRELLSPHSLTAANASFHPRYDQLNCWMRKRRRLNSSSWLTIAHIECPFQPHLPA